MYYFLLGLNWIIGNSKYVHDQEVIGINQSPFFFCYYPLVCVFVIYIFQLTNVFFFGEIKLTNVI